MATFFSVLAEIISAFGMLGIGIGVLAFGIGMLVFAVASTDDEFNNGRNYHIPRFNVTKRMYHTMNADVYDHIYDEDKTTEE